MDNLFQAAPQVRISYDNMRAYLYLPDPQAGEYSLREVEDALSSNGVTYGIDMDRVKEIVEKKMYDREYAIAEGSEPVDGIDGYYDYKFDMNFSKKPKLCPDGSVDYWSIKMVEMVTKDQVIAEYHKSIPGSDGMDVRGKTILAKRGRDQIPLRGKNFLRSEDGLTYTSLIDGKIEKQNDRIMILPVYEIHGDVDLSVGNIDFRGDVIVHGGVCTGVTVKATGTVTVDGIVEGAKIEAGKDIVLRSGVMGASKASVTSKGNISAKFFEYSRVQANGSIQADVFLNCQVSCGENILLDGKRSSIVGGEVGAIQGIVVETLGSDGEVKTHVRIGNGPSVVRRVSILKNKILVEQANLEKVEEGLEILKDAKNDPRKTDLLRVKIRDTALLSADMAELEKLEDQLERARGCCVKVIGHVYPGVCVEIDELKMLVKEEQMRLQFIKDMDKIVMCSI